MVVHGERYIDCCWYMVELEEKDGNLVDGHGDELDESCGEDGAADCGFLVGTHGLKRELI